MAYNSTSWTTDANTKAGSIGTNTVGGVTLYKEFGLFDFSPSVGTHNPMVSMTSLVSASGATYSNSFGGSSGSPVTTVDASDDNENPPNIIASMWYIEDNIYIDSVRAFATAEGSQSIKFHILEYDLDTTTNLGDLSEGNQCADGTISATLGTVKTTSLTVGSPNINAGKLIIAYAEAETGTSDITCKLLVKYHLS
jgi:hypothetical protein